MVAASAKSRGDPFEGVSKDGAPGTGRGLAADLLVVEENNDSHAVIGESLDPRQCFDRGMAAREIVDSWRDVELLIDAESARRRQVMGHDVPRFDVVRINAGLRGQESPETSGVGIAESPKR